MATMDVKDAGGNTVAVEKPLAPGRAAAASSRPVALSNEDLTQITGTATSLAIIDDWDESDRAKVNVIVGQAGITAGAGAVAANTPRVTHASDDPAVTALQIIDDWDETDRAKVNLIVGQAGVAAGAGAVGATTQRVTLASDDPSIPLLTSIKTAVEDTAPAVVIGTGDVIDVTLSLDTSAYADGDVLADSQEVASAFRAAGGRAILQTIHVLDEDDQGITFDLVILNANTSLGSENSAPNISDANARNIIACGGPNTNSPLRILAADYIDLGGCKVQTKNNLGLLLEAAGGSTSLWIGAITRGAPTHTASGIRLKLGFIWD